LRSFLTFLFSLSLFCRLFANTYTVTNTTDNGAAGTLRWAITQANTNAGADIIDFNLGLAASYTITVDDNALGALPSLTDNSGVTIDGWTNAGNNGTPNTINVMNTAAATPLNPVYRVVVKNSTNTVPTGLILSSNNNIIQGLVFPNFGDGTVSANDIAVTISGNSNKILGCYIGMDIGGVTNNTLTAIGISVSGSNNIIGDGTVAGANLISGMNGGSPYCGIQLTTLNATANTIQGNIIGLQKNGATTVTGANQYYGVYITNSAGNNIIGGNAGTGNIISGNTNTGIYINTATRSNRIFSNVIGTRSDGATNVTSNAQNFGVVLNSSTVNIIGSSTTRNIISANLTYGVYITGATATGNAVKGNYIGIASDGISFITLSAQDYGVYITNGATQNTIGGLVAGEGNIISGQSSLASGIYINSNVGKNTILGNTIGAQANGSTIVANTGQNYGINIDNSPSNIIGGNSVAARNIISGNYTYGILLQNAGCVSTIIQGNYIGISSDGVTLIAGNTQQNGIRVNTNAGTGTLVGGTNAGEGNLISGNGSGAMPFACGVFILGANGGTKVYGNICGTQKDGSTAVASTIQYSGVYINSSPSNIIGGTTAAYRNILSGNSYSGLSFSGPGATNNIIKGNYMGPASDGVSYVTNNPQLVGLVFSFGALSNTIGGTNAGDGNLMSGNGTATTGGKGISLEVGGGASNIVQGNIIGPQKSGSAIIVPNYQNYGIHFALGNNNNIFGGNQAGARNIISANNNVGFFMRANCFGTQIKGNYIGVSSDGSSFIPNSSQDTGVFLNQVFLSSVTIGGNTAGDGNIISGQYSGPATPAYGIYINGTYNNTIQGNIIGLNSTGTALITGANQTHGIYLNSYRNLIGGVTPKERNIISGNTTYGVFVTGPNATANTIKGNYIGLPVNGTTFLANSTQDYGVVIDNSASMNTIGGTLANEGNLISGNSTGIANSGTGVLLALSTLNKVYGNFIGTQNNGASYVANNEQGTGIEIQGSSNYIGGNTPLFRNIISANENYGIYMTASSNNNLIFGNYIGPTNGITAIAGSTQDYGMYVLGQGNLIGRYSGGGTNRPEGNIIAFNSAEGIGVSGAGATSNLISRNLIYTNGGVGAKAINLYGTGNGNKAFPLITSYNATTVSGTGSAGDSIEIFKNNTLNCQDAMVFLGTVLVNGAGNWSITGVTINAGEIPVATARTVANFNTSELSLCILTTTSTKTDVSCHGGSNGTATATPTGQSPYTYAWSPGGQTTQTATGLPAGTYTVIVTDASLVTVSDTAVITEPTALSVSTTQANVHCHGLCTGTISATALGGTPNYTYSWSTTQTTSTITGLCANNYTLTITDNNACTFDTVILITQPAILSSTVSTTLVLCNGGTNGAVTILNSGGTSPYTYSWSNSSTTNSISNVIAGNYTVTITDNNSCTFDTVVTITEPGILSSTVITTNSTCNNSDGSATINLSGGTGPYNYNWSIGGTNSSVTGIPAGIYSVTVTDNNGCSITASANVNNNNGPSASVAITQSVSCNGGSNGILTATISGGANPFTYLWSNGATDLQTTGLLAGNYSFTVTDGSSCTAISTATVVQPSLLTSTITSGNVLCNNGNTGNASIMASGGTFAYTYSWSNAQTGTTATGLSAATYSVTITDGNGCISQQTVTITEPAILTNTITSTDVSCFGGNNGSALAIPAGGAGPYSYLWNNAQTNTSASSLTAGTYTVLVTDANNCTIQETVTITQPGIISVSVSSTPDTCGDGKGMASAMAAGGTSPFIYTWSNGQTTQGISNLPSALYSVTVTDNNGCTQTQSININPTATVNANAGLDTTIIQGSSAQLNASGSGSYAWSPSQGLSCTTCANPIASPSRTTSYIVVVTDANGCTNSDTIIVTVEIVCGDIFVPNVFSPNGDGQNDLECVFGNCIESIAFTIYNRWGQIVFETNNLTECWNGHYQGKPMDADVFTYILAATFTNGKSELKKGNISLIR